MSRRHDSEHEPRAVEQDRLVRTGRHVQIIALVKPFRAQAVLEAIAAEGIAPLGGTVREALGHGRQKDRPRHYLGGEYDASFLPKVELTIFVKEEDRESTIRAVAGAGRTGRMGDGKILVLPCLGDFLSW